LTRRADLVLSRYPNTGRRTVTTNVGPEQKGSTIMASPAASSSSCPICFEEPADDKSRFLIRGKHCMHGFCKACLDKILLLVDDDDTGPGPHRPQVYEPPPGDVGGGDSGTDRDFSDVEISGIPTQGSCPICRARLSLFDVRWVRSNDCDDDDAGEGAANGDDPTHPYDDEIVTDWKRTPLAGKIYGRRRGVGFQSYHFDPADPDFPNVPHVNSSLAAEMLMGEDEDEGQADAAAAPRSSSWKLPIQEFKWHTPSRTMRGVVVDHSPESRDETDEHFLSFTSNLYCVRAGAQVTHRTAFASTEDMHRQYPLDGTYRCVVVNVDGSGGSEAAATMATNTTTQVVARGKAVTLSRAAGVPHVVTVLDPSDAKVAIVCPVHISMCRFAPFPFGERPEGPQKGDTIRFYVGGMGSTALSVENWTMVRKAAGTVPPPDVEYFVGPTAGAAELTMHYRLWTYAEQLPPVAPTYVQSELWGNAFCQQSEVGLGSYHFVAPSYRGSSKKIVAYVSFAQSDARRFATLDDGSDLPDRAHFKNATWDASTRTFVASLKWLDDWGAPFRGMKRWDVKMRFDSEYVCIIGGLIKGYPMMDGDGTILSVFGKDQLYFNACLDEAFCDLLGIKKEALDGASSLPDASLKCAVDAAPSELQRARRAESSAPLRIQPLLDCLQGEGAKARALKECRRMFIETCQRVVSVSAVGGTSDGS
jgi:Zinc finger, C3HC4 type (RING finger)